MSPYIKKFNAVRQELVALGGEVDVCKRHHTAILRYDGVVNEFRTEATRVLLIATVPEHKRGGATRIVYEFKLDGMTSTDRFYDLLTTFAEFGIKTLRVARQVAA